MKKMMIAGAVGAVCAFGLGAAVAASPADWSTVSGKNITVFYPGATPMEWILNGREHGGARAFRAGDTCADCHADETKDMGQLLASGEKAEPAPIAGKAGSIPVKVQAAHDGENLYLRFSWEQPKGGAAKMDEANPVKLAAMLAERDQMDLADQTGCWATCHADSRTMPEGKDDKKKYVKDGSLSGFFYDLIQWRSGENKAYDGHVADTRVMEGGTALAGADGKLDGSAWSVVFTRKLAGGSGDVALAAGKTYNFGFAIHDDHTAGRFHHVSLGYTLTLNADGTATIAR